MRKKKYIKKKKKKQESLLSPLLLASCSHIGSEARILTWPRPKKDVEHRGTQNNMSWQHRFLMFSLYCRSEKHSNTPKPASGPLSSLCSWCLSRHPFLPFPSERQLLGMGRWWEMHTHELFPSKCVTLGVDADSPCHLLSLEVCGKRRARIKYSWLFKLGILCGQGKSRHHTSSYYINQKDTKRTDLKPAHPFVQCALFQVSVRYAKRINA